MCVEAVATIWDTELMFSCVFISLLGVYIL